MNEWYECCECDEQFELESVEDETAEEIRKGIIDPICEPCRQRQLLLRLPRLIPQLQEQLRKAKRKEQP